MTRIPVLYLCSEAFSTKLAVTMASLLDHKHDETSYDIYVLVEKVYSSKNMVPFNHLKEKYGGFTLSWVEMGDIFMDAKVTINGVGKETLYRLLAAEKLPDVDRCIYLDSDTLILNDLTEMFEYDIQDCYIAGIYPKRFLSRMILEYKQAYGRQATKMLERNVGLCAYDQYVGAGVMIMNLRRLREDKMSEKFVKAVAPRSLPRDQDILNTCCYGRIAKLPVKYCIDLHELDDLGWFEENDEDLLCEIQSAFINPVVIHYSDRFKPWITFGLRYEKHWWEYAAELGLMGDMWEELTSNLANANPTVPTNPSGNRAATYQEAYAEFSRGISYRLGRAITYIPRKIYYFFKSISKRVH